MSINYLTLFIPAVIATAMGLAIFATRRVRRDESFTPEQRSMQLWFIWLLPILGASVVLAVLHDEPQPDGRRSPPTSQPRS